MKGSGEGQEAELELKHKLPLAPVINCSTGKQVCSSRLFNERINNFSEPRNKWEKSKMPGDYVSFLKLCSHLMSLPDREELKSLTPALVIVQIEDCNSVCVGLSLKMAQKVQLISVTECGC